MCLTFVADLSGLFLRLRKLLLSAVKDCFAGDLAHHGLLLVLLQCGHTLGALLDMFLFGLIIAFRERHVGVDVGDDR